MYVFIYGVSGHVGELLTLDVKEKMNDEKNKNIFSKLIYSHVAEIEDMIRIIERERLFKMTRFYLVVLAEVVTGLALIGSQYGVHFIKLKRHDEIIVPLHSKL